MNNDNIINKIKKLLAMADQNGGASDTERETAMRQATALMNKHNIELAETEERPEQTGQDHILAGSSVWKAFVFNAAASLYGCKTYRSTGRNGQIYIIGLDHNRQVTISMSQYLIKSIEREAKQYTGSGRRFLNNFRKGAAIGITQQTKKIINEREAAAQQAKQEAIRTTETGQAIVLADYYKNQIVLNNSFLRDQGVRLQSSRSSVTDHSGYSAGKSYGSNVSLNGQINSSSGQRCLS